MAYSGSNWKKSSQHQGFSKDFSRSKSGQYTDLWETRKFCYFTILVGSEKVPVHKCVLSVQSPVFSAMFETDKLVKSNKLVIKDCSEQAVISFLRAIYTGKIEGSQHELEVYNLACRFDVHELRKIYDYSAPTWINEKNAHVALKIGNARGSKRIIHIAFNK